MFPDLSRRTPLWEDSSFEHDHDYMTESEDLGLSLGLASDLEAWQSRWDSVSGELSASDRSEWLVAGRELAERLASEVEHFADISYEADWNES